MPLVGLELVLLIPIQIFPRQKIILFFAKRQLCVIMTNMDGILLSKKTSIALKGILCIFVLLHHLLRVDNAFIDSILNLLGPLAVGGFFLLSGYGLIVNYPRSPSADR